MHFSLDLKTAYSFVYLYYILDSTNSISCNFWLQSVTPPLLTMHRTMVKSCSDKKECYLPVLLSSTMTMPPLPTDHPGRVQEPVERLWKPADAAAE